MPLRQTFRPGYMVKSSPGDASDEIGETLLVIDYFDFDVFAVNCVRPHIAVMVDWA